MVSPDFFVVRSLLQLDDAHQKKNKLKKMKCIKVYFILHENSMHEDVYSYLIAGNLGACYVISSLADL